MSELTLPDLNVIDELAMLLQVVAEAAAKSGDSNAARLIATDESVQAHFAILCANLRDFTGLEASVVEYGRRDGPTKTQIVQDSSNPAGWPVWNVLVSTPDDASKRNSSNRPPRR